MSDTENQSAEIKKENTSAYVPNPNSRILEKVLEINSDLIELCKDFQNMGLVNDPEYMLYQMKLQSNLKYLATISDYYLNPMKYEPDLRPLPIISSFKEQKNENTKKSLNSNTNSTEHQSGVQNRNTNDNTLNGFNTSTLGHEESNTPLDAKQHKLHQKIAELKVEHDRYTSLWKERQLELSKRAKLELLNKDKERYMKYKEAYPTDKIVQALGENRTEIDFEYLKANEPTSSYKPLPPFSLPEGVELPPF